MSVNRRRGASGNYGDSFALDNISSHDNHDFLTGTGAYRPVDWEDRACWGKIDEYRDA